MAKRFTLEEAQRLLPDVERLLRTAIDAKTKYQEAERAIQETNERIMLMGGVLLDRDRMVDAKHRREEAAAALRSAIEHVQELGCLVKDLDIGLVDFPTLFRGTEVYLCWKFGEPEIAFWHAVSDGFRGRKPIDAEFLSNHCGDSE